MRNYKKESAWAHEKYDEIRARIDKQLGMQLRQKLAKEDRTISSWITQNAKDYIEKQG